MLAQRSPDSIGLGDYVQVKHGFIGHGRVGVAKEWAAAQGRVVIKWPSGGETDVLILAVAPYFKPGDWVQVHSGLWTGTAGTVVGHADDGTGDLFVWHAGMMPGPHRHRVSWRDVFKLDGPPEPEPEPEPERPSPSRMQALEFD